MELKTVKTTKRKYNLKPFGKFIVKDVRREGSLKTLSLRELSIYGDTTMPLTEQQENDFIKEMKKYKTDVFTDDEKGYYTIVAGGITRIFHSKLQQYKDNAGGFKDVLDNI